MRGPLSYSCPMDTIRIGYARCSTDRQDLTAQRCALVDLGVDPERIYTDHGLTGRTRARPGLDQALAAVRAGDTLVVTKLDRLARSVPDAREIADQLLAREVKLALGPTTHDPNDPMGKMFFNILATFAEFESDLNPHAPREGMASPAPRESFVARTRNSPPDRPASCGACTTPATTASATSLKSSRSRDPRSTAPFSVNPPPHSDQAIPAKHRSSPQSMSAFTGSFAPLAPDRQSTSTLVR